MPLIEVRRPPFGRRMTPILRDGGSAHAHAGERAGIVCRLRQGVPHVRHQAIAKPPAQLELAALPIGAAVGGQVDISRGTGRARVCGAQWNGVWQELLHQMAALRAEIGRRHRERRGEIALHQDLPVLRVAHAEIGIDRKRVRRRARRCRESVRQRERIGRAALHAQRLRKGRLLRHQQGDRLVDGRVAIHAVAGANDKRRSGDRTPRDAGARLKAAPVGTDQRIGIATTVERAEGMARHDRADQGEARRHVQVHQPAEALRDRRFILPPNARIHRQHRAHPPVVGDVCIVGRGAEVLVGVAKGDGARVRDPEQEVRQVRARGSAIEGERAARILLRLHVPLLMSKVTAKRDVVPAMAAQALSADGVRQIAVPRALGTAEPRDAAGKDQVRRTPIDRILIVPANGRLARDVRAIREVRRRGCRQARELIAEAERLELREPMGPVDSRVEARHAARVGEPEHARCVGRRALVGHVAEQLIASAAQHLTETRLRGVLMRGGQHRRLVVEAPRGVQIGRRVVVEERRRLRADARDWNDTAGKRQRRGGIDDRHRLP